MDTRNYFGKYNSIYFLFTGGRITDLCDRRSRKRAVPFAESELIDISGTKREFATMSSEVELPSERTGPVTLLNGTTVRLGSPLTHFPGGFGRELRYEEVEGEAPSLSVLLTIKLPPLVRYSIAWASETSHEATFRLAEYMEITVLTRLPWTYQSGTFATMTSAEEGEVSLLITSLPPPTGIRNVAIVCSLGAERQAAMARV